MQRRGRLDSTEVGGRGRTSVNAMNPSATGVKTYGRRKALPHEPRGVSARIGTFVLLLIAGCGRSELDTSSLEGSLPPLASGGGSGGMTMGVGANGGASIGNNPSRNTSRGGNTPGKGGPSGGGASSGSTFRGDSSSGGTGHRKSESSVPSSHASVAGSVNSPARCAPGAFSLGSLPSPTFTETPSAVTIADFNRDGHADLAATLPKSNSVGVVFGRGNGYFEASTNCPVGKSPQAAAAGDLNRDGIEDLVVVNYDGNSVSVLLGETDGTFATQSEYPTAVLPDFVALGDINGDGWLEVVTSGSSSNALSLLFNRGDGTLRPAVEHPIGHSPRSFAVGDLNGDGVADLAVPNWRNDTVDLLYSSGSGDLEAESLPLESASFVVLNDFNRDGQLDLAALGGKYVQIMLGRGNGKFDTPTEYQAGPAMACPAYDLHAGDFDGDGAPDLVMLNDDCDNVTILMNKGDGTFADAQTPWIVPYPTHVAAGDIDGNGLDDLVLSVFAPAFNLLLAQQGGVFVTEWFPYDSLNAGAAVTADFNTDGWLDVAVAGATSLDVLLSQPDGSLLLTESHAASVSPWALMAADADGNGTIDLMFVDGETMHVLRNLGSGLFDAPTQTPLTGRTSARAVGDVNSDGRPDLVATFYREDPLANQVAVLLGEGDGSFAAEQVYPMGAATIGLQLTDLDLDGNLDLCAFQSDTRRVLALYGDGQGHFDESADFFADGIIEGLAVGDLNGDGSGDLMLITHSDLDAPSSSTISVSLGRAGRSRAAWQTTLLTVDANEIWGIEDVDGNGTVDLILLDYQSLLFVVPGRGDGTFDQALVYPRVWGAPLIFRDFDGDGRRDLGVPERLEGAIRWNVYPNLPCQ